MPADLGSTAVRQSGENTMRSHAVCVLKFGGTSMGSYGAMQRCAEIVMNYGVLPHHNVVALCDANDKTAVLSGRICLAVVVSAVAGVTDWLQKLFAMAQTAVLPERQLSAQLVQELKDLRRKHEEIVEECALSFKLKADCVEQFYHIELNPQFARLEELLQSVGSAENVENAESAKRIANVDGKADSGARIQADCLAAELATECLAAECLAMGERLSSRIFAFVLRQNAAQLKKQYALDKVIQPFPVAGEELFRSDSSYMLARLLFEDSQVLIQDKLNALWREGSLPVVAGFTAADQEGRCTLWGRGGSDYSAAIIAAALRLPALDIWTDVAGIYSSDPRLVPKAKLWSRLDFALVSEMAYSGAKVVHPKSISIALQNQVAVIVRSTFACEEIGTLIVPPGSQTCEVAALARARPSDQAPSSRMARLAGLVLSYDSLLLHMENPNMLEGEGYIAQIAGAAHKQEIPIDVCATSETSFSFSIHQAHCNRQLLDDLQRIGKISAFRQLHKLCCVGQEIGADARFIAELLLQCQLYDVQIQTVSIGASHNNVTILFNYADAVVGAGQNAVMDASAEAERERAKSVELLRHLHDQFWER